MGGQKGEQRECCCELALRFALTSYLLAKWLDPCLELVAFSDLQKDMGAVGRKGRKREKKAKVRQFGPKKTLS